MKKIRVRKAKPRDLGLFRKLWRSYLEEQHKAGNPIRPSDRNMAVYEELFKKYTSGEWPGCCLFVAEDGVAMWGYGGAGPLEMDWNPERIAHGWGIYVRPDARRRGITSALRESGEDHLREQGFERVLGEITAGNESARKVMEKRGDVPHSMIIVHDLKKD